MAYKKSPKSDSGFARIVWANVIRQQYLHGVSDQQLSELMGVTIRTLSNYKNDPANVTIKQLQIILETFGIKPESLFQV